jgi:hypothetical protein
MSLHSALDRVHDFCSDRSKIMNAIDSNQLGEDAGDSRFLLFLILLRRGFI